MLKQEPEIESDYVGGAILGGRHQNPETARSFALKLGNSLHLTLNAAFGAEEWLTSFAEMFHAGASTAPNGPEITFVTTHRGEPFRTLLSRSGDRGLFHGLPSTGWHRKKLDLVRFWYHPASPDMICDVQWWDNPATNFASMAEAACTLYHGLARGGAFPAHAALLKRHGCGVLLAGPGGVGKTTCCRRVPGPWRWLSDDEALVVPGPGGRFHVHPLPTWSDLVRGVGSKSLPVERGVRLSAVFFLNQAAEDKATPLGQGAAAARMIGETLRYFIQPRWKCSHPDDEVALRTRVFENVCAASSRVPSFVLDVARDGRFWEEIERVLS